MRAPRTFGGVPLAANLYPDNRGRPGYWRYRRPDGTFKNFQTETVEEANNLANEANAVRHLEPEQIHADSSLPLWVEKFIQYREKLDPRLPGKQSWKNRRAALRELAKTFSHIPLPKLVLRDIRPWWDKQSPNAQRSKRPEYNRLFNYLMAEELVPGLTGNPFTTADDRPRVTVRPVGQRQRQRLSLEAFWTIYNKAGEMGYDFLQIGMGISLTTTMRRGDCCKLTFEHNVVQNHLCQQIGKSHAVHGDLGANLRWNLREYPLLKHLIDRARILALKHHACPYVLSRSFQRRIKGEVKTHIAQVLPKMLGDTFVEVRDATGLFDGIDVKMRPTFHEVRSLASWLLGRHYQTREVQQLMAHTDEEMTKRYQAGHDVAWTDINLKLTADAIGGAF